MQQYVHKHIQGQGRLNRPTEPSKVRVQKESMQMLKMPVSNSSEPLTRPKRGQWHPTGSGQHAHMSEEMHRSAPSDGGLDLNDENVVAVDLERDQSPVTLHRAEVHNGPLAYLAAGRASTPSSYPATTVSTSSDVRDYTPPKRRESISVRFDPEIMMFSEEYNDTKSATEPHRTDHNEEAGHGARSGAASVVASRAGDMRANPYVDARVPVAQFVRERPKSARGRAETDQSRRSATFEAHLRPDKRATQSCETSYMPTSLLKPTDSVSREHFVLQDPPGQHTVLDHPLDELDQMCFEDLQNEQVDRTDLEPISSFLTANESLHDRLKYALDSRDANRQVAVLKSLDIQAWQEAGEWFIESLSGVMRELVDLRREKRRLALEFEKEIAARHVVVQHKRAVLEETLAMWKERGAHVVGPKTGKQQKRKAFET